MESGTTAPAVQIADDLTFGDLGRALAAGCADFRANPVFGLFFAAIYVFAGLALYLLEFGAHVLTQLQVKRRERFVEQ